MSELEEKVARALAERMQINYDTMLAGERNHLHRDAQAVIPIIRKQIADEILARVDRSDVSPQAEFINAGLRIAAEIVEGNDE